MATVMKSEVAAEPLTLSVRPALEISDVQFYAFCRQNRDLRIEQTAQGDWIIMPPTGFETGSRKNELNRQLGNWAKKDGSGVAADSSTGYVLPNGAKRSPDASWVARARLAALTPAQKQAFLPLCADFVVDLRSPSDALAPLQEKMAEYRENGAKLGWLIDASDKRVFVYRPGQQVETLHIPQAISADPELPGFTLDLAPIWNPNLS